MVHTTYHFQVLRNGPCEVGRACPPPPVLLYRSKPRFGAGLGRALQLMHMIAYGSAPRINLNEGFEKSFCYFVEKCLRKNAGERYAWPSRCSQRDCNRAFLSSGGARVCSVFAGGLRRSFYVTTSLLVCLQC